MDARRWEAIQAAFHELVELDETTRGTRLAALGSTDPSLRAAVESLLAADAEASSRLIPVVGGFLSEAGSRPDPLSLVGRSISHFEVLEPLGAGGMGVVYRAQDVRLGRPVALKFLLPAYNFDAAAKARFLRESHSAAALDHPNVCTVHEVGEADGRLFLAMALYEGETLKTRLARAGPLPVEDALEIAQQIARALACAHAAGIVHRDLKPANVMILPDGTVKILDFGLARAQDQSVSETGARFGTVHYMAPEQIRGDAVDGRADLWALGVVLYELLTGRKPFGGEHEVAVAHAIVHHEPVPPRTVRRELSPALEDLVLRLLHKDPAGRYQSADDLLVDLGRGGTAAASAAGLVRTLRLRTRHLLPAKRRRTLAVGAVLALGALAYAAITATEWSPIRPDRPAPVSRYSIALPETEALAGARYNRVAISGGGEHLVYVGSSDGETRRLWLRRRDQLHAAPLPGTEGAMNPFFSPDGSRVGFVTPGPPHALKVVSLGGGLPITVTDSLVDGGGAAWGYDGYIYFDGHLEGDGLARVVETGGLPEPVTKTTPAADGPGWHFQPEALPNGKGVLFVIWGGTTGDESKIAVVDLESGVHRVLIRGVSPRYAASGHLVYVRADGALMAVRFDQDRLALAGEPVVLAEAVGRVEGLRMQDLAISATGTFVYTAAPTGAARELVWVARDGTTTAIDSTWRAVFTSLALSPDGAALAAGVQEGGESHVWIKPLNDRPAWKLTTDGEINDWPAWTPDGRAVAFVSNRRPTRDLYLAPADGSVLPQVLLNATGFMQEVEFSPDGKWVVYSAGGAGLYALRTDGVGTPTRLGGGLNPRLSPDGRWLAYSSTESGAREVYVSPFPNVGSARRQISPRGGAEPVWSRSGQELFYRSASGDLVAASVVPGATFAVGPQQALFSARDYVGVPVWRTYDVSPDGTRFVMMRPTGEGREQLIVVENFFEELKALTNR